MKRLNTIGSILIILGMLPTILSSCREDDPGTADPTRCEEAVTAFADYFAAAGNEILDPAFTTNSVQPSADFSSTGFSTAPIGLTTTAYKGAVDPTGTPWYDGWSFYSRLVGGNNSDAIPTRPTRTIPAGPTGTVTWSNDTTYILDGAVYVDDGQTLTIEAGTIIQGKGGQGVNSSFLLIARGGMCIAQGTAAEPIIMTFEGDAGNTSATTRGQWGGLIILGKAGLNSVPQTTNIEGLPSTEPYVEYGGNEDTDNSGIFTYISIRHGGTDIGAGNEINGLTLGGVGSGTTLNHIEVIGNADDGIEWFGGTVNGEYLISAFCADDALDYDEGYRGQNQFLIVHQDQTDADRGGEHDGGTDPETGTPYATPLFYNVTSIGNSTSRTLTFRDNAGGEYHNSIFTGFGSGVDIECLGEGEQDSYQQFIDGNLKLENNIFFDIGAGTTGSEIFTISAP